MSKPASSPPEVAPLAFAALVFVAGMTTMAGEILLSRFIGPYFGASLLIWTVIIFSVLVALTVGYIAGGYLADEHGRSEPLCSWLLLAAFCLAAGPFAMRLVLIATLEAKNPVVPAIGVIVTLLGLIFPLTLAGMTGPYMIRILSASTDQVGLQAGRVLALSTIGSILGTFLPTYVLIPWLGTLRSYLFLATLLGVVAVWVHRQHAERERRVGYPVLAVILGLWLVPPLHLRPIGNAIYDVESMYNDIQVKEQHWTGADGRSTWRRLLVLNEGFAVHSITNDPESPTAPLVGSVWDYLGLMPLIAPPSGKTLDVAIVGLAGGSAAKAMVYFFKPFFDVNVEGAELDPKILEVAKDCFLMTEPEIHPHVMDGRAFLASRRKTYDMILTDAYRQPYIPFHLVTQEYFQLVKSRLNPTGFAMINCGARDLEDELLKRAVTTMKSVFKNVYIMEVPRVSPLFANYLVLASERTIEPKDLMKHELTHRFLVRFSKLPLAVQLNVMSSTRPVSITHPAGPLTDDQAPVEHLIDMVILKTILAPGFEVPGAQR